MIDAATDFPFVAELPRREKSRVRKLWDSFQEMRAIQAEHGFLVPRTAAAALLEVHPTRIDQLCEAGHLSRIDWQGHRYVTENSLLARARSERLKGGRPSKTAELCASSPLAAFRVAKKIV